VKTSSQDAAAKKHCERSHFNWHCDPFAKSIRLAKGASRGTNTCILSRCLSSLHYGVVVLPAADLGLYTEIFSEALENKKTPEMNPAFALR
jgi:hypothetical protein